MTNTVDNPQIKDNVALKEARQLADLIASSLPERIQIAALSMESKLPFKALTLKELLLHRVSVLATSAVELFEQERAIPAVVLTRSIVETLAVLYALHERLISFLKTKNISDLDNFLMQSLMGARNQPDLPNPINILTLIDRVEKTVPGFRSVYDNLCEYTHPNWAGTFGAFGKIDKLNFEICLGPSRRTNAWETGVFALSGALMSFYHYYNESADLIYQLNDYFEKDVRGK